MFQGEKEYDFVYIGSTPCDEPCLPADSNDSEQRKECRRFIEKLRSFFGPEPEGAELRVKRESGSDFGVYYEVVCYFEVNNDAAVKYAFKCEGEAPATWDELPSIKGGVL